MPVGIDSLTTKMSKVNLDSPITQRATGFNATIDI